MPPTNGEIEIPMSGSANTIQKSWTIADVPRKKST